MSAWDNPAEMLLRAHNARAQGDKELAYQLFARASEINPQDAQAWRGRAETAPSADEALVSYAYASALEPQDALLAKNLEQSLEQRMTTLAQGDVPMLVALGRELAEVGLMDRAHSIFVRAAKLDPYSTDALVWSAGTTKDTTTQVEYLNRALAVSPNDPRVRAGLFAVTPAPPPEEPLTKPPSFVEPLTKPPTPVETLTQAPPPAKPAASRADDVQALLAQAAAAEDDQTRAELYERVLKLDPANMQAREARTMLRVRKLREQARQAEAAGTGRRGRRQAAKSGGSNARLRLILILLILVVIALSAAGVYLVYFQ